jgi:hypothetical protein
MYYFLRISTKKLSLWLKHAVFQGQIWISYNIYNIVDCFEWR